MEGVVINRIPEIIYPPKPDVTVNTLGRTAIIREAEAAVEARILDQKAGVIPVDSESAALIALHSDTLIDNIAIRHQQIDSEVADIKDRISNLEPEHAVILEEYCENSVPSALRAAKKSGADGRSWAEWLCGVERPQMLEFLRWHVGAIEQLASDPVITERIATQKAEYKTTVQQAIEAGWLHPNACGAIEKVDRIKVCAGDIFDTIFRGNSAYHMRGTTETVFSTGPKICSSDRDSIFGYIDRTTKHELNHATLGRFMWRWLDEAATEHIAHTLDYGKPETMDPDQRMNYWPPYYKQERKLLAYILNKGRTKIPARFVTRAYSEPSYSEKATQTLEAAVDQSWADMTRYGQDAYLWLNTYVSQLETAKIRDGMSVIEAGAEAAHSTLLALQEKPEIVFNGHPKQRELTFVA